MSLFSPLVSLLTINLPLCKKIPLVAQGSRPQSPVLVSSSIHLRNSFKQMPLSCSVIQGQESVSSDPVLTYTVLGWRDPDSKAQTSPWTPAAHAGTPNERPLGAPGNRERQKHLRGQASSHLSPDQTHKFLPMWSAPSRATVASAEQGPEKGCFLNRGYRQGSHRRQARDILSIDRGVTVSCQK